MTELWDRRKYCIKNGYSYNEGIEDAGVIPVIKHFGSWRHEVDSHYGLPIVYKTLEELRNFEFIPL